MADIHLDCDAEVPDIYFQANVMDGISDRDVGQPSVNKPKLFCAHVESRTRYVSLLFFIFS